MSGEQKVVDLLYWVRSMGIAPRKPRHTDRYLNPYTRRIVYYDRHHRNQLQHLLWLPTAEGVKEHLPYQIQLGTLPGLTTASLGRWTGAGPGESEAMLSLFHALRTELQLQDVAA